MPTGLYLSGSEVKYVQALSATGAFDDSANGSSGPSDLGGEHAWGNLMVFSNSADFIVNVQRSATSNGTFANIGCSITAVASKLVVRGFTMNSSATFYKVAYSVNAAAGSVIPVIGLALHGARRTPVDQDGNTTVWSNII